MGKFICGCWIVLFVFLNGVLKCRFQFSGAMNSSSKNAENQNGLLLYFHNYSFYSQKVLMALHEKKLAHKTHSVDIAKGEQYQPWFLEINPQGEVPVLKDGVKVIPDSARIIDYLEDNFSNGDTPRLIPLNKGAEVKQKIEHFREILSKIPANTVTVGSFYHNDLVHNPRLPFIAPVRAVMKSGDTNMGKKLRDLAEKNPEAREVLLSKADTQDKNHALVSNRESYCKLLDEVDATLQKVEDQLSSHKERNKWLVSDSLTVADIELTILLERLSAIGLEQRFWGGGKKSQTELYYKRVVKRESYKRTMPSPLFHAVALIGGKTLALGATAILASVAAAVYCSRKSN